MKTRSSDWLNKGLALLAESGPDALTIDQLCRHLGVTKGSFYHHFSGREDYLHALIRHWREQHTEQLIAATDRLAPAQRSRGLSEMARNADTGVENAIRTWARSDSAVADQLAQVDRARIDYLQRLMASRLAPDQEADRVAKLVYAHFVGAQQLQGLISSADWEAMEQLLETALLKQSMPDLPATVTDHLAAPIRAERLVQGTSNDLWRLRTPEGDWVWRRFAPAGRTPGVDRSRERTVLQALAWQTWVPQVELWTDQGMLMPFYQGEAPHADTLTSADRLALLDCLVALWQTPVDWLAYDYHEMVMDYARTAPDDSINRDRVDRLQAQCAQWPAASPLLTHHDLHAGNLLLHHDRWMLLDWEYASPGNPWIDAVSVDRWLGLSEAEKAHLAPALARWALPGDSWQAYHAWVDDLEALWYTARGE